MKPSTSDEFNAYDVGAPARPASRAALMRDKPRFSDGLTALRLTRVNSPNGGDVNAL